MAEKFDIHQLYDATTPEELRAAYDSWARDYDTQIMDGGWNGHIRLAAEAVPHLARTMKVLDAGAGSGLLGALLKTAGFRTIDALDASPGMLEVARGKGIYGQCVAAFLGEPLAFADDSYDAVLGAGVFTPGHAPPGSFDELIRIVRPGGVIAFTLRHDRPPKGFHEAMAGHEKAGRWIRISCSAPWQSLPRYEPEVHHEAWIWRVA